MSDKNILTKIKRRKSYLNKIVGNKIDKIPDVTNVDVNQDAECTILKNDKDSVTIKVNTKIFTEPQALFSIEIEYIIELTLNEEISDEEIKDNIDKIISPLGARVSYTVASITKEMHGTHLILPPGLNVTVVNK
jgi:hypothetical protein